MESETLTNAWANLGALVGRAHHARESTILTEHGKSVAAIVPVEWLEDYEDAMALLEHERSRRSGDAAVGLTHEEFMAQLEAEDRTRQQAS